MQCCDHFQSFMTISAALIQEKQCWNQHQCKLFLFVLVWQGVCTEAGMYALRERRVHVTQEDFEMAVAKVLKTCSFFDLCFSTNNILTCQSSWISFIYNLLYFHRWCRKTVRKTCPSRNSGSKHSIICSFFVSLSCFVITQMYSKINCFSLSMIVFSFHFVEEKKVEKNALKMPKVDTHTPLWQLVSTTE